MERRPFKLETYLAEDGANPFRKWIRDLDSATRGRVEVRLHRIEVDGNFGDTAPVGEGVRELRFHVGPGWRVYFGMDDDVVVLLGGGKEATQNADITEQRNGGATMMPKRTSSYRTEFLRDLKDPAEAASYLHAALDDSDEMFLVALRDIAEAHPMARVAEEPGLARKSMYRILSASGNPTYCSLNSILKAVGMRLAIEATGPSAPPKGSEGESLG